MFSFGPLSGLADMAAGRTDGSYGANAGTAFPSAFMTPYPGVGPGNVLLPGDPATTDGGGDGSAYAQGNGGAAAPSFTYNGAVGLVPDADMVVNVGGPFSIGSISWSSGVVTVTTTAPHNLWVGATVTVSAVTVSAVPAAYNGMFVVTG